MGVMVKAPTNYAEWVSILDQFKNKTNDEAVLAAMKHGTITWQSGVAERFSKKLVDAVNARMDGAVDRFQREMSRAGGQERVIVQSMVAMRKEFQFLANAVDLPVIPEKDRATYRAFVVKQADSVQSSLEDSAKRDRTGKLASIIRNNKVNTFS